MFSTADRVAQALYAMLGVFLVFAQKLSGRVLLVIAGALIATARRA